VTKRFVYAHLVGPDVCYVAGQAITDDRAPVLAACRFLVDLGYDRDRTLLAYRGTEIAMKLKIGDGARGYYRSGRMSWAALRAARRAEADAQAREKGLARYPGGRRQRKLTSGLPNGTGTVPVDP
jgi:hypothetical protein